MGKRMTRVMADFAAEELAKIAFDKKIEEAKAKIKEFADQMIQKLVPAPILALGKEYRDFFCDTDSKILLTYERKTTILYSNALNPISRQHFIVSKEDFETSRKLVDHEANLKNKKFDYIQKVSDALVQLKTEQKVAQYFPEALPYLNFSETTAIIPHYTELRDMLKQV